MWRSDVGQRQINVATTCILTLEFTTSSNIESTLCISAWIWTTLDNVKTTLPFSTPSFTTLQRCRGVPGPRVLGSWSHFYTMSFCSWWFSYILIARLQQKYNHVSKKNHFYVTQNKLTLIFVDHKLFMFNFYIVHWQHADLLRSGPRNKKNFQSIFSSFFFYSPAWYMEAVTKAAVEKSCSYLG